MIDWLTAAILSTALFLTVLVICGTIVMCLHLSRKHRGQDEAEDLDAVQADALAARKAVDEMAPRLLAAENSLAAIRGIIRKANPRAQV